MPLLPRFRRALLAPTLLITRSLLCQVDAASNTSAGGVLSALRDSLTNVSSLEGATVTITVTEEHTLQFELTSNDPAEAEALRSATENACNAQSAAGTTCVVAIVSSRRRRASADAAASPDADGAPRRLSQSVGLNMRRETQARACITPSNPPSGAARRASPLAR